MFDRIEGGRFIGRGWCGLVGQEFFIELLFGTLRFFLHPVFYFALFLAAYLGVSRVKRERKNFTVRVENAYFELRQLLPTGFILGLIFSIIMIGAGIVVPFASIIIIAVVTIVLGLIGKVRFLSPAFTVGISFFLLIFAGGEQWSIPFFQEAFLALDDKIYPSLTALLALLLIGEGILILINGKKGTSPKIVKSKRGKNVGIHEVKRVWLIPVFLLIPGTGFQFLFDWWPVFSLGQETFSLLLVPFAVGYQQQVKEVHMAIPIKAYGRRVLILGFFVLVLAGGSYWLPMLSIAASAVAILGREWIPLKDFLEKDKKGYDFSERKDGLIILGVLPDSPAEKLGLEIGEVVAKVNGTPVQDEKSFYEALQTNRAYCKLDVLDLNGHVRFVQGALYEGEHHQLGLLFVGDRH